MAEKLEIIIEAEDKASKTIGGIEKGLGNLGKMAGGALLGGVVVGAAAVAGLGAAIYDMVGEAGKAQEVQAQLNAVLEATEGAAGMSADEVNALASSLQDVTRFEDETIIAAETMLLQFRSIGEDVFPQATQATLDLATRMGIDAETAARMLGKALEEPGEGLLALKKAGVAFNEEQEKMIAAMVESGDTAGAQKLILAELEKSIGGAAVAAGETFPGKMDILRNKFGDVKETIGTAMLGPLTQIADKLIELFNRPEVQAAIAGLVEWLEENIPKAIDAAWNAFMWFGNEILVPLFMFFRDQIIPKLEDVYDWLMTWLPEAVAEIGRAFESFKNNELPHIIEGFNALRDAIGWVIDKIIILWDWFQRLREEWGGQGELKDLWEEWLGAQEGAGGSPARVRGLGPQTQNNYNLTIHSQAQTEQVAADFGLMRALAGA